MSATASITLAGPGLSVGKRLDITVSVSAIIEVDVVTAQRKATAWLVSDVGNLLMGDTPSLVIGQRMVWRVPALLTSPTRGVIDQIGTVDVDAVTGEVLGDAQLIQDLLAHARHLAGSIPSSAAFDTAPLALPLDDLLLASDSMGNLAAIIAPLK